LFEPNNVSELHDRLVEITKVLCENSNYFKDDLNIAANDNSWLKSAERYLNVFRGRSNESD